MLNVNVGVLGHVDCGKTSLAKALSTISSTAAFDKSPQSHARGITLDLGFSSFFIDVSAEPRFRDIGLHSLQVTVVDCPGHASLIRTVIGGAQIVDLMLLVVDATKGFQTQTAECLVVGEVIAKPLVVVVNKVDAVVTSVDVDREAVLKKLKRRLQLTMGQTRWPTAPIVEVAADPGAHGLVDGAGERMPPIGLEQITQCIADLVDVDALFRKREAEAKRRSEFLMFVDHCFAIRGQGTVLTGTVLRGAVSMGEDVCLPDFLQTRRVKGIQVFRKPVPSAIAGDRIGLCIAQFDPKEMERGIVCAPAAGVVSTSVLIAEVNRVRYHKLPIEVAQKFHISVGHSTVMGVMRFFASSAAFHHDDTRPSSSPDSYLPPHEFQHLDGLPEASTLLFDGGAAPSLPRGAPLPVKQTGTRYFAVVLLDKPVTTFVGATLIASRLDTELDSNVCRLAVVGSVLCPTGFGEVDAWRRIAAVKYKHRRVMIDRVLDERTCIVKGLVRPPEVGSSSGGGGAAEGKAAGAQMLSDVQKFIGLAIHGIRGRLERDESAPPPPNAVKGKVESAFGKTGKVRVSFAEPLFVVPQPKSKREAKQANSQRLAAAGTTVAENLSDTALPDDEVPDDGALDDGCEPQQTQTSASRVLLYFYTKKFPFATHCPLGQ